MNFVFYITPQLLQSLIKMITSRLGNCKFTLKYHDAYFLLMNKQRKRIY